MINHITSGSLSSKHHHKFLNCIFSYGELQTNSAYKEHLPLPLGAGTGLRLGAISSRHSALASGTMLLVE